MSYSKEEMAKWHRVRRTRLKALGLCVDCSALPEEKAKKGGVEVKADLGGVLCEGCKSDRRALWHERYSPVAQLRKVRERRLAIKAHQAKARGEGSRVTPLPEMGNGGLSIL